VKGGQWEELRVNRGAKKDVKVRLRCGNEAQEILAEAREDESDLLVLGCTKGRSASGKARPRCPRSGE